MLNSAQRELVLFDSLLPPAACVFCGKLRPRELCETWMCTKCKRKSLWELFWAIEPEQPRPAEEEQVSGEPQLSG